MKKAIIIALLQLVLTVSAFAESGYGRFSYPACGVKGGLLYNMHEIEENKFSENLFGESLTDGSAAGFYFDVLFEYPLGDYFDAGISFGAISFPGKFTKDYAESLLMGGDTVAGVYSSYFKASLGAYSFKPYLEYKAPYGFRLRAGTAFNFLFNSFYDRKDYVKSPADAVFIGEGSDERNVESGNIENAVGYFNTADFGFGWERFLDRSNILSLSLDMNCSIPFQSLNEDFDWNMLSFGAGASIRYYIQPSEEPERIEKVKRYIDTVVVRNDSLRNDLVVFGETRERTETVSSGEEIIDMKLLFRTDTLFKSPEAIVDFDITPRTLKVKRRKVLETFPFLTRVFFELNSSELSSDYVLIESPKDFSTDDLEPNPISIHKNALNVLGARMSENPDAKILLKGFADSTTENGGCELARARAESIKKYLTEIWLIEPERINVSERKKDCSPAVSTRGEREESFEENRRAEIVTLSSGLTAPIVKEYLNPIDFSPHKLLIDARKSKVKKGAEWKLTMHGERGIVSKKKGESVKKLIEINIPENSASLLGDSLWLEMTIEAGGSILTGKDKSLRMNYSLDDKEIRRISLLLFDFDSREIPPQAEKRLRKFLLQAGTAPEINVYGYTDDIGDEKYNRELSEARAKAAADIIKELMPGAKIREVVGYGSDRFPDGVNSYEEPYSRFLSRAVQVEIISE